MALFVYSSSASEAIKLTRDTPINKQSHAQVLIFVQTLTRPRISKYTPTIQYCNRRFNFYLKMEFPYSWQSSVVDIQLLRIGRLLVAPVPGEFTTMAGRRLRESILKVKLVI